MAAHSSGMTTLVEERQDLMVSSSSATPISRLAHFLTIPHNSILGSAINPPPEPEPEPEPVSNNESNVYLNFCRLNNPAAEWEQWVDLMYSKHQTLWRKAGILEALLNSKYKIYRNEDLLHAFASRWCCETNTFVFPWGEATLTLEDMMMLGGYSVVGDPVFRPLDTDKLKAIEQKLEQERLELCKTKARKASHGAWLDKFMKSGNEIEHEAFLVYWLSRFVFPIAENAIVKCVFPIALHLAKGERIALAPAVLASIYSDLNAYIKAVQISAGRKCQELKEDVYVLSPFNLIQIWVWERFPLIQPKPNNVKPKEPPFAKWHSLKSNGGRIVTNATHKEDDSFIWQPYATICGTFSAINIGGNERCVSVSSGTDEEVEAMIKCLRVSELVGIDSDCFEQYLPHRVARQFRMDQDIPAEIERPKLAREKYNRPIDYKAFCIPSHLYKPNVTVRYFEWWNKKPVSNGSEAFLKDSQDLKKQKLMDSAVKKPKHTKVCDHMGTTFNALQATGSRNKEISENLVSFEIGASKNRRAFGDSMSYKRLMKRSSLRSPAKKEDVHVLAPPAYLSKCNKGSARRSYAKDVENEFPTLIAKAFGQRISNLNKQNDAESVPCLSMDSVIELEARISNAEAILARYKID